MNIFVTAQFLLCLTTASLLAGFFTGVYLAIKTQKRLKNANGKPP